MRKEPISYSLSIVLQLESCYSQVCPMVTLEVGMVHFPLVQVENPAPSPEANPQYTVPLVLRAVALVGATEKDPPMVGMVVLTVRAGLPMMAGADPAGQEAKKAGRKKNC